MNLYDKISTIMTRQTFEYQNKKVRLFPRPSWRGRTVDREDLSSSRLNYNVTKTQRRIRFNQRQDHYNQIMEENKKLLHQLQTLKPIVPKIAELIIRD